MDAKTVIAKVCHEANRAWCEAHGDTSQASWEDAEDWQRESALKGIDVAIAGATPEEQHEAWRASKKAEGWKYGAVKNAKKKTHPCMVDYAELPAEQRAKDALFGAIVRSLAPVLSSQEYPRTIITEEAIAEAEQPVQRLDVDA